MAFESKMLLMTPEVGDSGTFVGSSPSAAGMGVDNLQLIQPTDRWRSTDFTAASPAELEMDFGTDLSVDTVSLLFTNATAGAEFRVNMHSSLAALWSAPDFTTGWVSHWPEYGSGPTQVAIAGWDRTHSLIDLGQEVTKRYFGIRVKDDSNPDGYYEAGRLYCGLRYQPTLNIEYGSGLPWHFEEMLRHRSVGGAKHTVTRPKELVADVSMEFRDVDELMTEMYELSRLRGVSKDVLYCHDPTSQWLHHWMVYGVLTGSPEVPIPAFDTFTIDFGVEELL